MDERQSTPEPSEWSSDARNLTQAMKDAEEALLSRPTVSIRFRLVVGFLMCFFLSGAIALATVVILYQVRFKLQFLETTDTLAFKIQQARRFEKNFFLYGTGLPEALESAQTARTLFMAGAGNLLEVVGEPNVTEMAKHLIRYVDLLSRCEDLRRTRDLSLDEKQAIEAQLREHGSRLIELAGTLASEERASVNRMIQASQIVPLVSLGVLLVLIIYIVHFLGRAIMAPLKRFQNYTRRIAAGDFSPIVPARPFRDEFSDLALALNRMLIELKTHEEKCIQAAKMAAIGTLTSGVAHELNNPLNNIAITTETLMDGNQTLNEEERGKLLQDVYFETERASETVKSLLDFSRMEKPEMIPIDLPEVIQSAARLAENEMVINNVTFSSNFETSLPRVLGAPNQLRHVFLNIFINSIQAMPSGGPLRVTAHPSDNTRVCVEIRDEGAGILPEHLPHIFDPFFTTKEPGRGTGLGLSVSYRIIQKHGGEMQISSESGKGTTVQVILPAA